MATSQELFSIMQSKGVLKTGPWIHLIEYKTSVETPFFNLLFSYHDKNKV